MIIGLNKFQYLWTIETYAHSFGGLAVGTEMSPSLMTFNEAKSHTLLS